MSSGESWNPFDTAEDWDVSTDTMLPVGNHRVRVLEAEDGTTGRGNPQVELKFGNDAGTIRAWEPYHSEFLRRIVTLYRRAGIQTPQPGEFDPGDNCRLTKDCIARLVNKEVGIVVREEPDNMNPGQVRKRVQGYVEAAKVDGVAAPPPAMATAGAREPFSKPAPDDSDIPF